MSHPDVADHQPQPVRSIGAEIKQHEGIMLTIPELRDAVPILGKLVFPHPLIGGFVLDWESLHILTGHTFVGMSCFGPTKSS